MTKEPVTIRSPPEFAPKAHPTAPALLFLALLVLPTVCPKPTEKSERVVGPKRQKERE